MKQYPSAKSVAAIAGLSVLLQFTAAFGADDTAKPAEASAPLSPAAADVLKLVDAKIADDTIVAFVSGSPRNYHLSAAEIIRLRGKGVSDRVLTAMLVHGKRPAEVGAHTNPAPRYASQRAPVPAPAQTEYPGGLAPASPPVVVVQQPRTTYIQTVPTYIATPPVYYSAPVAPYQSYSYNYPYNSFYYGFRHPGVSLSFGFGGGSHLGYYGGGYQWGDHWHGGFHDGGFHGGEGFHGDGGHGDGGHEHGEH